MSKIKLTKGELKKQRDSLKQFRRYLPTLILKKQQLQMKILEVRKAWEERLQILREKEKNILLWVGLLAEENIPWKEWLTPVSISTSKMNIAGANVPIFEEVQLKDPQYDFFAMPFWVDGAVKTFQIFVETLVEIEIIKQQLAILEKELRITTQRVNLFEKVKIPESLENIRKIRIYLGDQMANAVGIGKVAKKKVEQKNVQIFEEVLI